MVGLRAQFTTELNLTALLSANCEDICWYCPVCRSGASREQRDESKVLIYLTLHPDVSKLIPLHDLIVLICGPLGAFYTK